MNRELSLEEVHKETLNVLKKIDEICEHNDIKYSIKLESLELNKYLDDNLFENISVDVRYVWNINRICET